MLELPSCSLKLSFLESDGIVSNILPVPLCLLRLQNTEDNWKEKTVFLTTASPSSSVGLLVLYFSSLVICYFLTEVLIIILIISNSCIWSIFILYIRIFFYVLYAAIHPSLFRICLRLLRRKQWTSRNV